MGSLGIPNVARLRRSVLPRVALGAWTLRARVEAMRVAARRKLGLPPELELYVAFDDPYGAVAVPGLLEIASRRPVAVTILPVVRHGIPGDPDQEARRAYAIVDAERLLRRTGGRLERHTPIEPADVAFLAGWVEAARVRGRASEFASAAFSAVWILGSGPANPAAFESLYDSIVGEPAPRDLSPYDLLVEANTRRLHGKGHWETPAARLAGQWFFAHDRLEQIDELLARLTGE